MNGGDHMKHGIITKIEKHFMIVKTKDADIERIKVRPKTKVGERIAYDKKDIYKGFNTISYRRLGASLSVLVLLVFSGIQIVGQFNQNKIEAVVSFDVNPSININIDEENNVLSIDTKSEFSDVIIPKNYKGQQITDLLNTLTENALAEGLIQDQAYIVISYTPIKDPSLTKNEGVSEFIQQKKERFKILFIVSDEDYLDDANASDLTVGKKYLSELLNTENITIDDTTTFIQQAMESLTEQLPINDEGFIETHTETPQEDVDNPRDDDADTTTDVAVDDSDRITDEETTSSDEETRSDEDTTVDEETDDETVVDEETDDDTTVDEEEEDTSVEDEKRAAEIAAQKKITDRAYQTHLVNKIAAENLFKLLQENKSLTSEKESLLDIQVGKYNDLLEIETTLLADKESIDYRIDHDMTGLIEAAALVRDTAIATTNADTETIQSLKAEANSIYSSAYNVYQPIASDTLTTISNYKQQYQADITAYQNSGAGEFTEEIALLENKITALDNMTTVINSRNGLLDQSEYDFGYFYNNAYQTFDASRSRSNTLHAQANTLQNQVNTVIASANASYDQTVLEITAQYEDDLSQQLVINSTLEDVAIIKPTFQSTIGDLEETLLVLEAEGVTLQKDYNQAEYSRKTAYDVYLVEKGKLNLLEDKE